MKRIFKVGIIGFFMFFMIFAFNINALAVTFTTSYGTATGTSSTTTWHQSGTPNFRRVMAKTTNSQSAPKIAADVYGYYNGNLVMFATKTETDRTSATAIKDDQNYAKKTITGNGCHAVWSSTLSRTNYYSYF